MSSFATSQRRPHKPFDPLAGSVAAEKAPRPGAPSLDAALPATTSHDLAVAQHPLAPIPLFRPDMAAEVSGAEVQPGASEAVRGVVQARMSVKQVGVGRAGVAPNVFAMPPVQRKNTTGLPDVLKEGVEALSGVVLDDVRVHYNSAKPAEVQASAYAQGTEIHVGPGQERHLPHEAWHVVQQRQGRVAPTVQVNGVSVNDDASLEREADAMGSSALRTSGPTQLKADPIARSPIIPHGPVIQRDHTDTGLKKESAISEFGNKVKARVTGAKNPLGSTKQWDPLSEAEKIAKVTKYVNAELEKTHVPKVGSQPDATKRFDSAEFDFQTWELSIGSQGLDAPMTDDDVAEMADTVYHESRHAEQWFRIARLKAGEAPAPTAAALADSLFIPQAIAKAALARPLKPLTALQKAFHSKKYAERHQTKMDEAASWHDSIYGAGAGNRNAVLSDLANRNAEYRALSEEVDAWAVGGASQNKILALLQVERQRIALQQAAAVGP
ncbi:MAG: DUF4157 domain-containing protein [Chloroflexota bacterium]|nr:DUF4157 domain-containing protein [Chloroflexota bacterium]